MELLSSDVSSAYILMSTSVLPFSSWYSVTCCIIYSRLLLMDICWFFSWIFFIDQIFAFVKVVLGPHAALSCSYSLTPSTLSPSRRPPSVGRARIIKVIKVVEHKVHILLLFSLQMMYNPLILVNLYPDMRISLS